MNRAEINLKTRRALLAAIIVLLVLAAVSYAVSIPEPVRVPQVQLPVLPEAQMPGAELSLGLDDVFSRPLFWASRRPLDGESVVESQAPSVDGVQVLGVFLAADHYSALLSDGAQTARVFKGDSFAGWRLEDVRTDGVVLVSSEDRAVLPVVTPPSPTIRVMP